MYVLGELRMTLCIAVLVRTVTSLDLQVDLLQNVKGSDSNDGPDACPARTTAASERTCPPHRMKLPMCHCDCNNGDCEEQQKALKWCESEVFYSEQKKLKLRQDDEFLQAFCKKRMDCADTIQCYVTCCLQGKGAQFMKLLMRSVEFETLKVCHPNADPKFYEGFKKRVNCRNSMEPSIYQCITHYNRNVSAAMTEKGVDIPRFCCAFNDFSDCYYRASHTECCDDTQRLHYKKVVHNWEGETYRLLCSDDSYSPDSPQCKCLPPVDKTGTPPPSLLEARLAIARGLTNSSSEYLK